MASIIGECLEEDLFPLPDRVVWKAGHIEPATLHCLEKVEHYVKNFFQFVCHLFLLPWGCLYSLGKYSISWFQGAPLETSVTETSGSLPAQFGFSTSMYQDSGLGTSFAATPFSGIADWDEWLNPDRIEGTDSNYRRFFFDILRNPDAYIHILQEHNVNAHRFSLEWAVIEPSPGQYDPEAVDLYRGFIQRLKESGIEPYVTLHHFVCPKWFKDSGGFDSLENIEVFQRHALHMMELFPEVTYWIPFNEINVDAFQKCIRGVYPPGREGDIAGAGRRMRNLLIAHCKLYQEAKERWPDKQIGSTHQWLKFEPLNGNVLEQTICYFLSKITHYACYEFFKTGRFALQVPAIANVQFEIPKEEFTRHRGFSDFLGVQFYGFPRLMAGWNGGQDYPGFGIKNYTLPSLGIGLTFGSTCPPGGAAQSFGPGIYPESLKTCLEEAVAVVEPFPGKKLVITETGCDARVWKFGKPGWENDFEGQKNYFEKILPVLQQFQEYLGALFVWTLANGQEWERADGPILNVGTLHRTEQGVIENYEPYPAAQFLKELFGRSPYRAGEI